MSLPCSRIRISALITLDSDLTSNYYHRLYHRPAIRHFLMLGVRRAAPLPPTLLSLANCNTSRGTGSAKVHIASVTGVTDGITGAIDVGDVV